MNVLSIFSYWYFLSICSPCFIPQYVSYQSPMKLNAPSPPRSKKKGKSAFIFSSKFVNHFVTEKDVNSATCRTRWQDFFSGCITFQTTVHNLMQSHIKFSHLLCSITLLLENCYFIVSIKIWIQIGVLVFTI